MHTVHARCCRPILSQTPMSLSLTCLLHRRHQHHLRVRSRHPACDFPSPRSRRRLGSAKQHTSTNVDDDVMQWQRCDCYATERSTHGRRSCKHTCKDCEDYFGNIALAYPVKRDASDDSPAAKQCKVPLAHHTLLFLSFRSEASARTGEGVDGSSCMFVSMPGCFEAFLLCFSFWGIWK